MPSEAPSDARQAGGWIPPLQEGTRLAWPVLCMRETPEELAALKAYLCDSCTSTALVTRLTQLPPRAGRPVVVTWEVAAAVTKRSEAILQQAGRQAAAEFEAAQAAATAANAMASQLAESLVARVTRLAALEANGGVMAPTLTLTSMEGGGIQLQLETFRPAAVAVAPFVTNMRAYAATSSFDKVARAAADGLGHLASTYERGGECHTFGVLELYRHLFVYAFGTGFPGDVTTAVNAKSFAEISAALGDAAVAYEARLRNDLEDMRRQRQQVDQLAQFTNNISKLIAEYCMFFHVVMAVADGISKHFFGMSSSFHPGGGVLYGASRFPAARTILFAKGYESDLRIKTGRSAITGLPVNATCPAFSPDASYADRVMPTATAGRSATLPAVLTLVIAPPAHISAFVMLSALAALPLREALEVVVTVSELQSLYQQYQHLTALVKAMSSGNIGAVWRCAQEVSAAHLDSVEPLLSRETLSALLSSVRQALCYQYAGSRSVLSLCEAAAHFGLPGGAAAMQAELEPLIRAGRLPMSINAVDLTLTQRVAPGLDDPRVVTEQALEQSRVNAAEMELWLRRLAAQRQLAQPTFDCILVNGGAES